MGILFLLFGNVRVNLLELLRAWGNEVGLLVRLDADHGGKLRIFGPPPLLPYCYGDQISPPPVIGTACPTM